MVMEQPGVHVRKNKGGPLPHITHTKRMKMNQRPKYQNNKYENIRRIQRSKSL